MENKPDCQRTGNEELLDCEMWIVNYCKEKLKKMVWVHGTANRLIILDPEKISCLRQY